MASNDDRAHIRLPASLKKSMVRYAQKRNTTLSALAVQHFTDLLRDENKEMYPPDADQV